MTTNHKTTLCDVRGCLRGHFGHLVIWSKSFSACQNPHYNNKYIYYYSEQMTESENENDLLDLDHRDHKIFSKKVGE